MLEEICFVAIIIICIIIILYILSRSKGPFSINKKVEQGNVRLEIKANNDIKLIEVKSPEDSDISFIRKGLKKDEMVEFVFPYSGSRILVIVHDDAGIHRLEV